VAQERRIEPPDLMSDEGDELASLAPIDPLAP
jgi:hypothetical protein